MESCTVALFGEAEKGEFQTAYFCKSLEQLADWFGNPPSQSKGLHFAVQALLYHRNLIFFRVREEGFSENDYYEGIQILKAQETFPEISAICIPGVGSVEIIREALPLCHCRHSILVITETDFYDYLTFRRSA